jgi:hypothetical protein
MYDKRKDGASAMTNTQNQTHGKQGKTSVVEREAPAPVQFVERPKAACCVVLKRPTMSWATGTHTRKRRRQFSHGHGKK